MILQLLHPQYSEHPDYSSYCERLSQAQSLAALVLIALQLGLFLARIVVEDELNRRAQEKTQWPPCPSCSRPLRSHGFRPRQLQTLIGQISWKRRVGYCRHCKGSLCVPLDEALGIEPYQSSSSEVVRLGCLLSVLMPYELATWVLGQCTGISVSASSLWNWVEQQGRIAMEQLEAQVQQFQSTGEVCPEKLDEQLAALTLASAADGVMVPMRPYPKSAAGQTQWREVKVGLLARLAKCLSRSGKSVTSIAHRRVVAVLGNLEAFIPRLHLEAERQGYKKAPQVIWLSDGGRGFWRVYRECFGACAIGILDFYHAAGHLWRATTALLGSDASKTETQQWFERWRHLLRHGQHQKVIDSLTLLINDNVLEGEALETLIQVQGYFQEHRHHIQYQTFEQQQLPLGSGMIESTCKWLIQQRFKGVGMRWSENGFNHLLHLRLLWANQRFDDLFPTVKNELIVASNNL